MARHRVGGEPLDALLVRPPPQDGVRRAHADRGVEHRAAAQAAGLQRRHDDVAPGRPEPAFPEVARQRLAGLAAVIAPVDDGPGLEHDDVEPRGGQAVGEHRARRSRADHAHVAAEHERPFVVGVLAHPRRPTRGDVAAVRDEPRAERCPRALERVPGHAPGQPGRGTGRGPLVAGEDLLERAQERADVRILEDHRREDLDGVEPRPGDLHDDAAPVQVDVDGRGERAAVRGAHQRLLEAQRQAGGGLERHADDQPLAGDAVDHVEAVGELLEAAADRRGQRAGAGRRVEVIQDVERRKTRGHREVVLGERREVDRRGLEVRVDAVVDVLSQQDRADRDLAAGQCLADRQHPRPDARAVAGEPGADAPEPRLHLVHDEHRAVALAEPLGLAEVRRRDDLARHPLHRLDEQRGDVAVGELAPQRVQVVARDRRARRHQRVLAGLHLGEAAERDRAVGASVERAVEVQPAPASGDLAGEADADLGRLRARVREHHLLERRAGEREQPLGEQAADGGAVDDRQVRHVHVEDVAQRGAHPRVVAADEVDAAAGEQVQVPAPVRVPQVRPLAASEHRVHPAQLEHPQKPRVDVASGQMRAGTQAVLDELPDRHGRRWSVE